MNKFIQISILLIYILTSCFVVGSNRWKDDNEFKKSKIYSLVTSLIISIDHDSCDNDTDLPILIKDPKEDTYDCLTYTPSVVPLNFVSENQFIYFTSDIEEPSINIVSPPPQIS